MKKTLLLLASAALLLVGCAKDNPGSDAGSGEMVTASFTAQMQGMPQTKTVTDGQGTEANRCVMEIYYKGVLYAREVKSIADKKATFAPRLVSNRTYDVLFWADCGDGLNDKYYKTDAEGGLQAVEMMTTTYDANDDARDAFFINKKVEVKQQVSSEIFSLTRPFSQVNIITTDASIIEKDILYPDGVKMVYKAPTKFNLLTGELSETKELTVTGTPYEVFNAASTALTLEMDYLFAGEEKSALDIAFEASKTGETAITKHSFTNIPVQRNYRTNIKGALLTTTGNWTAEITPAWDGEEDVPVAEVGSVAAANEAFANGATNVKITSVGEETTLYLPETTEKVTIDFANPDKVVTVDYRPAAAPTNAPAPTTKAAVEGVQPSVVNIATNDVTKFVVTGISNVVWLVGNQAALANALNNAAPAHTVALSSDITMTDKWISVRRGDKTPNFDGRNHVISNMTIETEEDAYVGLFSQITNRVTLQNVTFKNAKLMIPESVGEHARGGVLVGHAYPINVYNCHVEGAEIVGCQKLGGLIGYIEGDAANATVTVKDCSVKDINISSNRPGKYLEHGVGGFIGHISLSQANLITIENNSVENVTITGNKPIDSYSTSVFIQLVPHVFIGNVCNTYTGADASSISAHSVVLKNNSISGTNTALPTCIYSSEYFGWGGNAEERPAWKGKIYIDGEEWTPNYPVKIVGGKGYATLAEALTAATEGQTVQILKAGDYTVETLSTKAAVVEATVEGVVFNHTPAATSWVASCQGTTIKNITWNVGTAHHQYFSNTNLENCTVNGLLCTHITEKFKDCTFINEDGYNFWVYGNEYTEFDNCTFTCPGKNDGVAGCGSAINCYNEGDQHRASVLVVKNCTFTAKEASNKYSAIYVKPETTFDIRISNSTCNDKFCTGTISGSKLWDLKSDREGTTVSIDGKYVYPFCSKDADGNYHIINAAGLLQFHDLYNAGKVAYTAKVYLDNDIDFTGKIWTACDWHADKTTKGFALFDGQNHTIKNFTVSGQGMFSRWGCTSNIGASPYFKDIVFDGAKNVETAINVSLFCGQTYQNAKIENVTIKNSQFEGKYKVAPFVGSVYDESGRKPTLTFKDCKVENTTVKGTLYDFDICGMVAWVYEDNNDKIAFEGNNVVKDVTLYIPGELYNMCAKIYHNGEIAYNEAANVTVTNVNVVNAQ